MRSKAALVLSVIFILAMGTAALVVNTRVLETSTQNEIGRADEVLTPTPPAPASPTGTPPSVVPASPKPSVSRGDDDRHRSEGRDEGSDREHDDSDD